MPIDNLTNLLNLVIAITIIFGLPLLFIDIKNMLKKYIHNRGNQ